MATNHSTETTAKLLEPNQPETDTLWESCVEVCNVCLSSWLVVCYRKKKNRMFPCRPTGSGLYMSQPVSPLDKRIRWVFMHKEAFI